MIALYLLAPWMLRGSPGAALLVPGLLAAYEKKVPRPSVFVLSAALYILAGFSTGCEEFVAFLGSLGILYVWVKEGASPIEWRPLVLLLTVETALLALRGDFRVDRLPGALSYLFTTILFVYSEEVFLRRYLREKIGRGPIRALLLGVLWGCYHLPFEISFFYLAAQILHGAALSALIDAVFDRAGIATAVALHALHNALPLLFRATFTLFDHVLFFVLLLTLTLIPVTGVTDMSLKGRYHRGQ
ncbi:MAG: CPBP family glutamic-type intramembrane protease [Peptoniphilus sp.]|nr:CPBP family glutamic-type intramembrane protease [Peptoniphilus sp.]MDD7362868.1 CPBP family glutamic-type intramembrane protease [Bacillota bacterium]MDY6044891.1 CPBP family glutamic-type intramembrane protease [Peptoniphilus sp.]